jgi:membrane-associated phospholipid phosphatase
MSTDLVSASKTAGSESSHDSATQRLPVCHAGPSRGRRGWLACGLFVAAGFLAMGIDVPLSRALAQGSTLQANGSMRVWLTDSLGSMEPFGKPPVIVAVSLAVYLCCGSRRRAAFRIAGSFLLASLAANAVKLCIARVRPRQFDFGGTVLDTFRGICWGTAGGSANQSFPSAHTTVAVAFCLALSTVFPRGRWLFAGLAALVALQRIECGAHYLSDTLFAASLAWMIHVAVFGDGPLCRWFDKLESMPSRD